MTDTDFYIDAVPEVESREDKVPKPLEGRWWKFGLGLSLFQVVLWVILGFRINPDFSLVLALSAGQVVYGVFIFLAFLPFALARLGFKRMMWFTLIGTLLGFASYVALALFEPARQYNLLPFYSYIQFSSSGVILGLLWEFGRWVFIKVFE